MCNSGIAENGQCVCNFDRHCQVDLYKVLSFLSPSSRYGSPCFLLLSPTQYNQIFISLLISWVSNVSQDSFSRIMRTVSFTGELLVFLQRASWLSSCLVFYWLAVYFLTDVQDFCIQWGACTPASWSSLTSHSGVGNHSICWLQTGFSIASVFVAWSFFQREDIQWTMQTEE